jgi:hypothetical protein
MVDGDWERGDLLGHDFPVHIDALRNGGPEFLTAAFRASGALESDNRVAAITQLEHWSGGSTGRKALLRVEYERPGTDLPETLFVKFSRDPGNKMRDRGRWQMESEVRFGLVSSIPDFPVAVPRCLFGEYSTSSGSGVLVTERIAYGEGGIEPHHAKARDYEIDDVQGHYDALVSAIARLAGNHRAGRLPGELMEHFPARSPQGGSSRSNPGTEPYTPDKLAERIDRYADFARRFPQLLPEEIRSEDFIARLREEGWRAVDNAEVIRAARQDEYRKLYAFCHWNANIDNAWFWHDSDGRVACGLMDWGNVGQINMVNALTSCLMFAEADFVIDNLDHLFGLFARVFTESGGGALDPEVLKHQFSLGLVADGLRLPLDRVALVERHVPDLELVEDRFDPRIADDEFARTQLHILTWALLRWEALDVHSLIDWSISNG